MRLRVGVPLEKKYPVTRGKNRRPARARRGGGSRAFERLLSSCDADVARSTDDVVQAWSLLHDTYVDAGYIHRNPHGIHTAREALINATAVFVRRRSERVTSTLSCINDGPAGLPLDSVYPEELCTLRSQGHRLIEVGLFADRSDGMSAKSPAVLGLMRMVYWWGVYTEATDLVIGVHPRRVGFYKQAFGFHPWGSPTSHPHVRSQPVQLLHGSISHSTVEAPDRYSCMRAIMRSPVDDSVFESRVDVRDPADLRTLISGSVESRSTQAA